jgi:hypothetical protein
MIRYQTTISGVADDGFGLGRYEEAKEHCRTLAMRHPGELATIQDEAAEGRTIYRV